MKKIFLLTAVTIIVLINFNSCKKSDNDPALPFATRDALITNTWKLSKMSKIETTVNELGNADIKTYSFDGTTMNMVHTDIWGSETTSSYSYSDKLIIAKDNTYRRTIEVSNTKSETKSYWFWHDAYKNKVGISFNDGVIYYIKKLGRKELVLELLLHQRPGCCLACNLTQGLPQVFARHPIINIEGIVQKVQELLGSTVHCQQWRLGSTEQRRTDMHVIPLIINTQIQ